MSQLDAVLKGRCNGCLRPWDKIKHSVKTGFCFSCHQDYRHYAVLCPGGFPSTDYKPTYITPYGWIQAEKFDDPEYDPISEVKTNQNLKTEQPGGDPSEDDHLYPPFENKSEQVEEPEDIEELEGLEDMGELEEPLTFTAGGVEIQRVTSTDGTAKLLRPYQVKAIQARRRHYLDNPNQPSIIQMATGTGKTFLFARDFYEIFSSNPPGKSGPFLFLAHREELLQQIRDELVLVGFDPDLVQIVQGCDPLEEMDAWVASVPTMAAKKFRRVDLLDPWPEWCIIDEAHHASTVAKTYEGVIKKLIEHELPHQEQTCKVVGYTATPERRNAKERAALAALWPGGIIYQYSIMDAILEGYLAHIKYFQVKTEVDISKVKSTAGDFNQKDLEKHINIEARNKAVVEAYVKYQGGKCFVFAATIAHAEAIADRFRDKHMIPMKHDAAGSTFTSFSEIRVEVITGETDKERRARVVKEFKEADQDEHFIICNVGVFTEGVNVDNVDMVILAAPTKSPVKYLQCLGRGTRKAPGKEFVKVIDIADIAKSSKIQRCLTTVFELSPDVQMEGDIVEQVKLRNMLFEEGIFNRNQLQEMDFLTQENLEFVLSGMLFAMPPELETSKMSFYSPEPGKFYCQVDSQEYIEVRDKVIDYEVYMGGQLREKTVHLKKVIKEIEAEVKERCKKTRYMWDKKFRSGLKEKPVSVKQAALLRELYPFIDPEKINRETASLLIGSHFAQNTDMKPSPGRNDEPQERPITIEQKLILKNLGYSGDMLLTEVEANQKIEELF